MFQYHLALDLDMNKKQQQNDQKKIKSLVTDPYVSHPSHLFIGSSLYLLLSKNVYVILVLL